MNLRSIQCLMAGPIKEALSHPPSDEPMSEIEALEDFVLRCLEMSTKPIADWARTGSALSDGQRAQKLADYRQCLADIIFIAARFYIEHEAEMKHQNLKHGGGERMRELTARPLCQSCHERKVNRPRGLCWRCFYLPDSEKKFPSTSKFARLGVGTANTHGRLPAEPTQALPGSEEKILVMEERAERGESIFHPEDAKLDLQ